jgi:hypothetical protein
LDQKLDSIVALLKSSQSQKLPDGSLQLDPSDSSSLRPSIHASSTFRAGEDVSSLTPQPRTLGDRTEELLVSPMYQPRQASYLPSLNMSSAEADDLLHVYQSEMIGYFPFVIVPSGVTTQNLRTERPFLFATIMLAASREKIWSQTTTGMRLIEYLSVCMLQNGEKSLDLLQGLLVYIAWSVL